jgi:hypothetical protein
LEVRGQKSLGYTIQNRNDYTESHTV